jgi:hypothetical protein
MTLTAMKVYLEPPREQSTVLPHDGLLEYSRNEPSRRVARVNVIPTPQDGSEVGEEITVKVFKARRARTEEVVQARQTYVFDGTEGPGGAAISLDLPNVQHSERHPFPVMRRGNYFFRVEHSGGTTGPTSLSEDSDDWRVALMTVDRFEAEWLRGATRRSNDDRAVRFQPKRFPFVRVVEVSRNHPLDLLPLSLVKGNETDTSGHPNWYLSWNRGKLMPIDTRIPEGLYYPNNQIILPDRAKHHYIVVEVDPRLLVLSTPERTQETELLMIDRALIDRESLRRWLDEEFQWMESSFFYTPIEPALIVSERNLNNLSLSPGQGTAPPLPNDNEDYDILSRAVTYYPPEAGHWINLRLNYGWPIKFDYLEGALENQRIVSVNTSWIHAAQSNMLQLVPFNQSLAYHFLGLFYMGALRGPADLPGFWRYRYYAGVQDEVTPYELLELGGMRASIKALTILGQMFRGGFSSQSVSRDGVSESVGYTASAMYGIYSATIEGIQKRLDKLEPQLQRKYKGLYIDVL